jgi:hypothetical protein
VSGDFGAIIANDNVDGQAIVEIVPTDVAFSSSRCGTWVAFLGATPVDSFGDGSWVVNSQITPGRWRSSGGTGCCWERERGFSGGFEEIIANDDVDGSAIVDIRSTDAGFKSARCGAWTKASARPEAPCLR